MQMGRELRRNSRNAVFEARQKLTSSSGTRASFDYELMAEYADYRLSGMLALPALLLILALFASLFVGPLPAVVWVSAVILANFAVLFFCKRFKNGDRVKFNPAIEGTGGSVSRAMSRRSRPGS